MENYYVNNYMIRSRQAHMRETVASFSRAAAVRKKRDRRRIMASFFGKAPRSVLSILLDRSGKLLVEAGSSLQKRSLCINDLAPSRHGRAA